MVLCVNNEGGNQLQDQMLLFGMFAKLPLQFLHDFVQKDKTAMFDLGIDSNLHYSHKGSFSGGSHNSIMCEKLHIWVNYRGAFP